MMNGWSFSFKSSHSRLTSSGTLPLCFITRFKAYLTRLRLCSTSRTTPAPPAPMILTCFKSLSVKLVSWRLMRSCKSRIILSVTIDKNAAWSIYQRAASLLEHVTLADRGSFKMRDRSPKNAFLPMVRMSLPLMSMVTSPLAIRYKRSPASPCRNTESPFANWRFLSALMNLVVWSTLRCLKIGTFLAKSIFSSSPAPSRPSSRRTASKSAVVSMHTRAPLSGLARMPRSGPGPGPTSLPLLLSPSALARISSSSNQSPLLS
mmetsp:Transcript_21235/g.36405  ORF Transcript_21235/g.36405 Transcript_21235/m.36405 type:complete len:262 (-) Transcript_21235:1293-2078(-)